MQCDDFIGRSLSNLEPTFDSAADLLRADCRSLPDLLLSFTALQAVSSASTGSWLKGVPALLTHEVREEEVY